MNITLKNNKGEFTVSLEDVSRVFAEFLLLKYRAEDMPLIDDAEKKRSAELYGKDLLDFLQSYGE